MVCSAHRRVRELQQLPDMWFIRCVEKGLEFTWIWTSNRCDSDISRLQVQTERKICYVENESEKVLVERAAVQLQKSVVLWNKGRNNKKTPEDKLGRCIRKKNRNRQTSLEKKKTEEDKVFKIHKYLMGFAECAFWGKCNKSWRLAVFIGDLCHCLSLSEEVTGYECFF